MNQAAFERSRPAAIRRVKAVMKKWGGIDPWPDSIAGQGGLSFAKHAVALERLFPGCSVAWDVNPATRAWERYDLKVAPADQAMPRRLRNPQASNRVSRIDREALHVARRMGHHLLTATKMRLYPFRPFRNKIIEVADNVMVGIGALPAGDGTYQFKAITATYVPMEERWIVLR